MPKIKPALLVLAVGFVVLLYNGGSRFTMGLMLKPMADDLAWGRSTLSLTVTLFMIVTALALPLAGRLVDRFNTWTVLGVAMFLSGAGIGLMRTIESPIEALFLYGIVFALASAGTSITPIGVIVSRWFPNRMGLANSIAISGMGVGQLVIILLLTQQLEHIGWRGAFTVLGLGALVLVIPLALLAVLPITRLHGRHAGPAIVDAGDVARQRPLGSRYFWVLLAIYAICGFQDFFVATHVVAYARDQGIETILAGNLYAFMGLMGLTGVLITGHLSDRYGPWMPTALCFVLRIAIFSLILISQNMIAIGAFALLFGLTFWITAPLTVVFVRLRFGDANLGAITGLVTMVHHGAGGLGAFAGGYLFDADGDYVAVFKTMLVLSVVALLLTFSLVRSAKAKTSR
jgi:MFS family permease